MNLFFKKIGEGKPLFILHGLFGLSDNWSTLSKGYAEKGFSVFAIDLRNHGRSGHSDIFTYETMANDLDELIHAQSISSIDLIGHSMGGKVGMQFALMFPEKLNKLIVADISPKYYPPHHASVLAALHSVQLTEQLTRKEAENTLRMSLNDEGTIQFLLKNLYWETDTKLNWRFGLKEIENNIDQIGAALVGTQKIDVETLFVRGERSGYINDEDIQLIKNRFSKVEIITIPNSGHWVHAENPKAFFEETVKFLIQ